MSIDGCSPSMDFIQVADFADDNPLLLEIQAEKASAYFATIRKMNAALAALSDFDRKQNSIDANNSKGKHLRGELLAGAAQQVWFFVIQREALKLPYYEELFAHFDIPDEVRKQMGPKL